MAYLLDSNVFIQAKNLHYGFDFCPAFWDWVENSNADGRVFSIEKVADELLGGADELTTWAQQRGDEFFLKPDAAIVPSLQATSQWAAGQGYDPAAVNTFLQVADYYLLAHAHARPFSRPRASQVLVVEVIRLRNFNVLKQFLILRRGRPFPMCTRL